MDSFLEQNRERLLPSQVKALNCIQQCRSDQSEQMLLHCPDCGKMHFVPHSCGHRSCPSCQNHLTTQWLHRQKQKLLKAEYFLVTFTVPSELRQVAFRHQKLFYSAMFDASSQALKEAGAQERWLGGEVGMTGVLHTHARDLAFHPHIHYIVPAGAWDRKKREWKRKRWNFLFPGDLLARLFREKLTTLLSHHSIEPEKPVPYRKWVADCKHVGSGIGALEYLSRYLYRGVVSEKKIKVQADGKVCHQWTDSKSGETKSQVLAPEKFVAKVLTHVLPQGFRRVRDYGFLHGNAKTTLRAIQVATAMLIPVIPLPERPGFVCPRCKGKMVILFARLRSLKAPQPRSREPPKTGRSVRQNSKIRS
jgi:hypothetical protein